MALASQNEWNRIHCTADEFALAIPPKTFATVSWWLGLDRPAFFAQLELETARMERSAMAKTIRPMLLGGKLP